MPQTILTLEQRQSKQLEANELQNKLSQLREDLGREADYSDTFIDEIDSEIVLVSPGVQQIICSSPKHKIKEVITFKIPPSREGHLDEYTCRCGITYRKQI